MKKFRYFIQMMLAIFVAACNLGNTKKAKLTDALQYQYPNCKIADTFRIYGMNTVFNLLVDTTKDDALNLIRIKDSITYTEHPRYGIWNHLYEKNVDWFYFDGRNKKITYETYSNIGYGFSIPMQTIINTAASKVNKQFSRQELDSFFRRFIFGAEGFDEYITLYDSSVSTKKLFGESYKGLSTTYGDYFGVLNKRLLSQFYDFIEKNKAKPNFFFYRGISGTSGAAGRFLITVNEQFSSDSAARAYFNRFANGRYQYMVKCYFPYYVFDR